MLKMARFCEFILFGGFKSWEIEGTLLFAKAKRSKKFVLGASHEIIFI